MSITRTLPVSVYVADMARVSSQGHISIESVREQALAAGISAEDVRSILDRPTPATVEDRSNRLELDSTLIGVFRAQADENLTGQQIWYGAAGAGGVLVFVSAVMGVAWKGDRKTNTGGGVGPTPELAQPPPAAPSFVRNPGEDGSRPKANKDPENTR